MSIENAKHLLRCCHVLGSNRREYDMKAELAAIKSETEK